MMTEYQKAMEEAARICEHLSILYLSPDYAIGQPASSMAERYACANCALAIRRAAGLPDPYEETA